MIQNESESLIVKNKSFCYSGNASSLNFMQGIINLVISIHFVTQQIGWSSFTFYDSIFPITH